MRFLFGIILGGGIVIAGAYVHDLGYPDDTAQRLVNWSKAGQLARSGVDILRGEFNRLIAN